MKKNINNYDKMFNIATKSDNFATEQSQFTTAIEYNNPVVKNDKTKIEVTNNKFIKVMIAKIKMLYGLSGVAHDTFYYLGSIIIGRGIDDESRFIVNINADFYRKAAEEICVSTATVRRAIKELIDKGLLLKEEDGITKSDYLFNFMAMYKGTDEDYTKDCIKYNIKDKYEKVINKITL